MLFKPLPSPGSSGGPIVDEESGAVVGVMLGTRMDNRVEGLRGWGVPSETIFEVSLPASLWAVFVLNGMVDVWPARLEAWTIALDEYECKGCKLICCSVLLIKDGEHFTTLLSPIVHSQLVIKNSSGSTQNIQCNYPRLVDEPV